MKKNYYLAIATLMGAIIGVGVFTLPYVAYKSGLLLMLIYFPILAFIQNYLHLLYAEIVLSTKEEHRLPGYAEVYGGKKQKIFTLILTLFSDYGVLLTYIIVGGLFLHQLLAPIFGGEVYVYATILFALEAGLILLGLKAIAGTEFFMTSFMVLIVGLIAWRGWDMISVSNFSLFDWQKMFYPYGPVFFAIGGAAAVPEVCKLLTDQKEKIKSAITWGTYLSAIVVFIFCITIVGITGSATTPDALQGLGQAFGNGITKAALIFGLLAITTSLLAIMQACREIFWWDFKINKYLAWLMACSVPYLIYIFGWRDITAAVSLIGAFSGGMLGLVMIMIVWQIKKKAELKSPVTNYLNRPLAYGLSAVFILGLIYEIAALLK